MTEEALVNPEPGASDTPNDAANTPAPSLEAVPDSILNSPEPDNSAPQTWPDDWRQNLSGGDEKHLKMLERLNSPADLGKSFFEAQKKISSFKPAVEKPGEDATPEQVQAYRESLGIPEDPSGYDLDLGDGTAIGEDVKPYLDGFLEHAHSSNLPPDVVKSTVDWYLKDVEAQQQAMISANDEARVQGLSELKAEWGGEFQGNMNAVQSLFTSAPEGTMDKLLESAGENGLKFANDPDNIRWLVGLAKQLNPTSTLVPPGPDQASSIDAELEKITAIMNSPDKVERDKYWKNNDMQARFAQLNQAKAGK